MKTIFWWLFLVTEKRWKLCVCECSGTDLHSLKTPSHFQRFHRQLQSAVRRRGSAVCYNLVASVLIYDGVWRRRWPA